MLLCLKHMRLLKSHVVSLKGQQQGYTLLEVIAVLLSIAIMVALIIWFRK